MYEQGLTSASVLPALSHCSLDDGDSPVLQQIIEIFTDALLEGGGAAYVREHLDQMPQPLMCVPALGKHPEGKVETCPYEQRDEHLLFLLEMPVVAKRAQSVHERAQVTRVDGAAGFERCGVGVERVGQEQQRLVIAPQGLERGHRGHEPGVTGHDLGFLPL